MLFVDRSDVFSVAFQFVTTCSGAQVTPVMTPDPSHLLQVTGSDRWDEILVDHSSLRRSARAARDFLSPLLELDRRPRVTVVLSSLDDAGARERGLTWVSRDLQQAVMACGVVPHDPLTDRERDVLRAVAAGRSNEQIGRQLQLSLSTVKTYLERIHAKLGSVDRASAVATAVRCGWI
jgi:DNA-binding CsgD family transcriptional regulator